MQRRYFKAAFLAAWGWSALSTLASAQSLPPDVRAGHWAATPVQVALRNRILSVEADKSFHGDAKVTHLQAVLALARLGQALETGAWRGSASVPVTAAKTGVAPKTGTWEAQEVSRYVFATVLARVGDYTAAGLVRPQPNEKDLGKSVVLPPAVALKIPHSSPAYSALEYLAAHRMIGPGSPLLSPDDKPLKAAEMSRALKELVAGVNDRLTDVGHDENGGTHDEAFHRKNPPK
jgi:hypothetical protein